MRRLLWNTFSTLAILILIFCVYSWVRSYLPRNSRIDTSDGRLLLVFWEGRYYPQLNMVDPSDDKIYAGGGALWKRLHDYQPSNKQVLEANFLGFGTIRGPIANMRYHVLAIPSWFLALLAAAPPTTSSLLPRR